MTRKTLALLFLALILSTGLRAQGPPGSQAKSFLVGGLLYAGNFPINNPGNTGDFGYAILYSLHGQYINPVDTILFDSLGYYYFFDVAEGQYLVKAGLTPNSSHFGGFLPAYYGQATQWDHADTLTVSEDQYNADIRMIAVSGTLAGERTITGFISVVEPQDEDSRVPGCEVILTDTLYQPLACTYSNGTGAFTFNQVSNGTYFIFGEYTGKFSQKAQITVDEVHPFIDSVEIKLFTPVLGIETALPGNTLRLSVSPNPASGKVSFGVESSGTGITLAVCTMLGREILSRQVTGLPGKVAVSFGLEGLKPGIYIVTATGPSPGSRVMKKLIVY